MALDLETEYVNATPADADYPFGSAKNETSVGALDGFPFEKAWFNDFIGFFQKLLSEAGITPSGVPDTVLLSDYFDGLIEQIAKGVDENPIINGACEVAQGLSKTISNLYQIGQVDLIACKGGGTVTAGSIIQNTTGIGRKGFSCMVDGFTATGAGAVTFGYRVESRDAKAFKNKAAIFHCLVKHDAGISVDYTITVKKADVADNFSAVTTIGTSSAIAVATATETQISLAIATMGDCSNGIQIEVLASCGAVTGKDFQISELQLDKGAMIQSFKHKRFARELNDCKRYYERIGGEDTIYVQGLPDSGGFLLQTFFYSVEKRDVPNTITKNGTWSNANCDQPSIRSPANTKSFVILAENGTPGTLAYFTTVNDTMYVEVDAGLW